MTLAIFKTFLKLGLTSFGGPVAHLGYYRREFVERRGWLDESHYAQLVSLCQLLPGPASSQTAFAIGLLRGGWWGALAAFVGFTLPSALLLLAFARLMPSLESPLAVAALHGLKLLTVAVVAHAVVGMARTLTPDLPRIAIAVACMILALWLAAAALQPLVIVAGALIGLALRGVPVPASSADAEPSRVGPRTSLVLALVFAGLLAIALAVPAGVSINAIAAAFYRAGALVFGGGHVVLPLLREAVVDTGAAHGSGLPHGLWRRAARSRPRVLRCRIPRRPRRRTDAAAAVALLAIFLPGFLLVGAALPWWHRLLALRIGAPRRRGRQCRGDRSSCRGPLRSGVDQRDRRPARCGHRRSRLRPAVVRAALGAVGGGVVRGRRRTALGLF